jgi:hypothetical protein
MENLMDYYSVTCACRKRDELMQLDEKGTFKCASCGLSAKAVVGVLPDDWFLEPPEQSDRYPFCEICGEHMRAGGGGWSEIGQRYYKDMAFFCAKIKSHIVGSCFREISEVEYKMVVSQGRESLLDAAVGGYLFCGREDPSIPQGLRLLRIDESGRKTFDFGRLDKELKALVKYACECYLSAGLIREIEISEDEVSFIPEESLLDSIRQFDGVDIIIGKPGFDQ